MNDTLWANTFTFTIEAEIQNLLFRVFDASFP